MNDPIDPAKRHAPRAGGFSRRATGLVPALSHRRLRQLRISAGGNAGGLCRRNNWTWRKSSSTLQTSHEQDEELQIAPLELAAAPTKGKPSAWWTFAPAKNSRRRGSKGPLLFSQPLMQEILGRWPRTELVVVYDHRGRQSLDAAAYFMGHGFTRCAACAAALMPGRAKPTPPCRATNWSTPNEHPR